MKTAIRIFNVISIIGSIGALAYVLIMRFTLCNICSSEDPATAFDANNRLWLFITMPFLIASAAISIVANKKLDDVASKREILPLAIVRLVSGIVMLGLMIFVFIQFTNLTYSYGLNYWLWVEYIWFFVAYIPLLFAIPAGVMMLLLKEKHFFGELPVEKTVEEEYVEESEQNQDNE